jgi:uroporphyrinogen-III synthase
MIVSSGMLLLALAMKASLAVQSAQKSIPSVLVTRPRGLRPISDDEAHLLSIDRLTSHLVSTDSLDELLNDVLEFSVAVVRCDSCHLYVLEENQLVLRAATSMTQGVLDHVVGSRASEWFADSRSPVVLSKLAYTDSRFKLFNDSSGNSESFVCVPLSIGAQLVGVMNLYNGAERAYESREISLVSLAANLLSLAIDRDRLQRENAALSEQLETRKLVERAKGILQRDLGIGEEEAYLILQRESRNRRKLMKDIAAAIILSDDLRHTR